MSLSFIELACIRPLFSSFWGISCVGALKATSNRGLQPAMDHLVENEGKPVPDLSTVSSSTRPPGGGDPMDEDEDLEALKAVYGTGGSGPDDAEAKVRSVPDLGVGSLILLGPVQSIKCSQCGKVFRNTALANYHAEKSGHDQFEESTEEVCARP